MRPSYDLGITHWMFDDGTLLCSELHLKLDVEVDGEVEWIRTEVACRIHSYGRFEVTRPRNKPAKILRSSS